MGQGALDELAGHVGLVRGVWVLLDIDRSLQQPVGYWRESQLRILAPFGQALVLSGVLGTLESLIGSDGLLVCGKEGAIR